MTARLEQIYIYPIKSIQGIAVSNSEVTLSGLNDDRQYMLVDEQGMAITAREHPQLSLVSAKLVGEKQWQLQHPAIEQALTIDGKSFSNTTLECQIWDHQVSGHLCAQSIDQWFSELLETPVQLVYFGPSSTRFTNRKPDAPVAFADGYPFLLTNSASLAELNRHCPEDIQMLQFRPNLVVDHDTAFAEDSWKRIKIGEVIFENVKPCERCIFTTLNLQTAQRSKKGEPLKSLAKFRLSDHKTIDFGINLIAENSGRIQLGDTIEILEYQTPPSYKDKRR